AGQRGDPGRRGRGVRRLTERARAGDRRDRGRGREPGGADGRAHRVRRVAPCRCRRRGTADRGTADGRRGAAPAVAGAGSARGRGGPPAPGRVTPQRVARRRRPVATRVPAPAKSSTVPASAISAVGAPVRASAPVDPPAPVPAPVPEPVVSEVDDVVPLAEAPPPLPAEPEPEPDPVPEPEPDPEPERYPLSAP